MFQDGMGAKREQMTFGFYPSPVLVLSTARLRHLSFRARQGPHTTSPASAATPATPRPAFPLPEALKPPVDPETTEGTDEYKNRGDNSEHRAESILPEHP